MNRNSPSFLRACQNVAALVWGGLSYRGVSKEELWNALPEADQKTIADFIEAPKVGPSTEFSAKINDKWLEEHYQEV